MKNKGREFYKPKWCSLNGYFVTSLNDVSMKTNFDLEQCFCSCPSPLKSMLNDYYFLNSVCTCRPYGEKLEYIEVHYDDCPNAKRGYFYRYVTKEEKEQYRREYT